MESVAPRPAQDPPAPLDGAEEDVHRPWVLRSFVVCLLVSGAIMMALSVTAIIKGSRAVPARRAAGGVTMPRASQYQDVVGQLLARKAPEPLLGLTIAGSAGKVTVLRASAGQPFSFPSSYLNPGALAVIARSIGAVNDQATTVADLRLELVHRTGRLRWRLRRESHLGLSARSLDELLALGELLRSDLAFGQTLLEDAERRRGPRLRRPVEGPDRPQQQQDESAPEDDHRQPHEEPARPPGSSVVPHHPFTSLARPMNSR